MVLKPIDKSTLNRLRNVVKKEQIKTGKRVPQRVIEFFGRMPNVDERKLQEFASNPVIVARLGRRNVSPGFAVRLAKIKGQGVVLKLPTLATHHLSITPLEEIKFVRTLVDRMNAKFPSEGFVLHKPVGHPVGPFIAMRQTNYPTIWDLTRPQMDAKTKAMLLKLSKEMGISQRSVKEKLIKIGYKIENASLVELDNNRVSISARYPAGLWVENSQGERFQLKPLNRDHLQIMGQKKGVIQLVPFIDAI